MNTVRVSKSLLFLIGFCLLLSSCKKKDDIRKKRGFELLTDGTSSVIRYQDTINMGIRFLDTEHSEISKFKLFINNQFQKEFTENSISIETSLLSLGVQQIQVKAEYTDGKSFTASRTIKVLSNEVPKTIGYDIAKIYPHDIHAYTQGLEFSSSGVLYESTGQYGFSSIRKVNFKNGKIEREKSLEKHYFGEGLTLLDDQIYQLTWQEMSCFVYKKQDFEKIKTLTYPKRIEGWGLCNDGKQLIMSDGTENIYFLNPQTLEEERSIQVYDYEGKVELINELEYIDGKIFANVYTTDSIIIIDPTTGKVEGVLELDGILGEVDYHEQIDVLNGVAYHKERGTCFITGKNWPKLFELKIKEG